MKKPQQIKSRIGNQETSHHNQLETMNQRTRATADHVPGELDLTFNPGSSINGQIRAMAVQPDGKVLIVGDFTTVEGAVRGQVARLNPDGTAEPHF